jgi:RHS repeat-associated protein
MYTVPPTCRSSKSTAKTTCNTSTTTNKAQHGSSPAKPAKPAPTPTTPTACRNTPAPPPPRSATTPNTQTATPGLIYLRVRTYDSATAQFLSVDPLEKLTGAPYDYAEDNPLTFDDPEGLATQYCAGIAVSIGILPSTLKAAMWKRLMEVESRALSVRRLGPGVRANIHYGEGTSNACNAGEYGDPSVNTAAARSLVAADIRMTSQTGRVTSDA